MTARHRPGTRDLLQHRAIEMLSAFILGLATVGTGWCAYQSAQWNQRASADSQASADARTEGTRLYNLATTSVAYDTNVITAYADAVASDQPELAELYNDVLVRPEFRPILNRWKVDLARGETPTNLIEDQDYIDGLFGPYREADTRADKLARSGVQDGRNAIDYLVATVLLAMTLFFAGVTNVFRGTTVKLISVSAAGLVLALAASRITGLPVS